jgi:pimeloyl-ACP methyl ester carboxylesterase
MRRLLLIFLVLISACSSTPGTSDVATVAPDQAQQTPPWTQRFVDNAGVRIEYRVREVAGAGADRTPVVFIPGMSADASVWENNAALVGALDAAGPRKLIAVSLRGRGASDCPDHGWTPQDHQSDIAAVVRAEKLGRYHLVAHSMGVAYAVGFALSRPRDEIQSFIAADYPPKVFQVTEEWASMVESMQPPLTFDPRMPRHVLREQGSQDYTDRLDELRMPMLVILGRKSMDPEVEGRYAKAPRHQVLWIEHGHMTFTNAQAIAAAVAFLQSSD